jgi:TRAP-type C4-dicarboxylate transport system permease small subunit
MESIMLIDQLENKTFRLIDLISKLDIIFLFGMMIAVVADVVLRLIYNYSIPGIFELVELSMILIVYLGLAATQTSKMNISVDFFVSKLPLKIQFAIDIANHIICFCMAALIAYQGFIYLQHLFQVGRDSDVLHIPVSYFQIFSVIGWFLLAMVFLIDFLRCFKTHRLWSRHE